MGPEAIVATGEKHLNGHADVAYITIYFGGSTIAHVAVNWLSPVKVRTTLIGGEKKMLVWNDLEADEKVKVYDKGVSVKNGEGFYQLLTTVSFCLTATAMARSPSRAPSALITLRSTP